MAYNTYFPQNYYPQYYPNSNFEKNDRWRNIIIVLLIVLLVITNAMWLIAWNQYDYIDGEVYTEVDAGNGTANYIGHNGDINNGKDNSSTQDTKQGS